MTKQITPLRQRMLDDMALRNMSPATQRVYINAVKNFSEPGKPFKPKQEKILRGSGCPLTIGFGRPLAACSKFMATAF